MQTLKYYDRTFYIPVTIDISDLKAKEKEAVQAFLQKEGIETFVLSYPSDLAEGIAAELPKKGHKSFGKALPYEIGIVDMQVLFSKCLEAFNPRSSIRKMPEFSRVKKEIKNTADYKRVVDDLLLQQDGITLSQIFDTAVKPSVAIALQAHAVNNRLSRVVITVSQEYGKNMNDRLNKLKEDIAQSLILAKHMEDEVKTDSRYAL